jgi:hypothetical protein
MSKLTGYALPFFAISLALGILGLTLASNNAQRWAFTQGAIANLGIAAGITAIELLKGDKQS